MLTVQGRRAGGWCACSLSQVAWQPSAPPTLTGSPAPCCAPAGGVAITTLNFGSLITGLYCFGLFLGTIYSVPPLRLKRSAVAAFMIIATGAR